MSTWLKLLFSVYLVCFHFALPHPISLSLYLFRYPALAMALNNYVGNCKIMLDRNISSISFIFCALCVSFRFALVFSFFFAFSIPCFCIIRLTMRESVVGVMLLKIMLQNISSKKLQHRRPTKKLKMKCIQMELWLLFNLPTLWRLRKGKTEFPSRNFSGFLKEIEI